MHSIGEISKIVSISVDTLRYYDEIGLLKPYFTDQESRYRYYSDEQVNDILNIIEMKQYGLSLDEIKELIRCNDNNKLIDVYSAKLRKLNSDRNKISRTIELLQSRIEELKKGDSCMEERTVLIVDDVEFMRRVLKDILEKHNYKVIGTAINGKEAVEKYEELKPSIVIMDIHMSFAKDGIDAVKEIKSKDSGAEIVMLSALGTIPNVLESIQNGAKDFIVKPFASEALIDKLGKALNNKYHASNDNIVAIQQNAKVTNLISNPMSQDTIDRLLELCSSDNKVSDEQINDFINNFRSITYVVTY